MDNEKQKTVAIVTPEIVRGVKDELSGSNGAVREAKAESRKKRRRGEKVKGGEDQKGGRGD